MAEKKAKQAREEAKKEIDEYEKPEIHQYVGYEIRDAVYANNKNVILFLKNKENKEAILEVNTTVE